MPKPAAIVRARDKHIIRESLLPSMRTVFSRSPRRRRQGRSRSSARRSAAALWSVEPKQFHDVVRRGNSRRGTAFASSLNFRRSNRIHGAGDRVHLHRPLRTSRGWMGVQSTRWVAPPEDECLRQRSVVKLQHAAAHGGSPQSGQPPSCWRRLSYFTFRGSDNSPASLFLRLTHAPLRAAFQRDEHMRMTAMVGKLSPSARAFLDVIAAAASLAFLLLIIHPAY
jgi:hypothetical protein